MVVDMSLNRTAIQKHVLAAAGSKFDAATLTKPGGTGDPTIPGSTGGAADPITCLALETNWTQGDYARWTITASDAKILVIAASLASTPEIGDTLEVLGVTRTVQNLMKDPAGALWTMQARL